MCRGNKHSAAKNCMIACIGSLVCLHAANACCKCTGVPCTRTHHGQQALEGHIHLLALVVAHAQRRRLGEGAEVVRRLQAVLGHPCDAAARWGPRVSRVGAASLAECTQRAGSHASSAAVLLGGAQFEAEGFAMHRRMPFDCPAWRQCTHCLFASTPASRVVPLLPPRPTSITLHRARKGFYEATSPSTAPLAPPLWKLRQ